MVDQQQNKRKTHLLNSCPLECLIPMMCVELLSRVWLFVTPWTVALQAPLSMGILQARILGWVAMPSSGGSSKPRVWTQVSCTARGFVSSWATREALIPMIRTNKWDFGTRRRRSALTRSMGSSGSQHSCKRLSGCSTGTSISQSGGSRCQAVIKTKTHMRWFVVVVQHSQGTEEVLGQGWYNVGPGFKTREGSWLFPLRCGLWGHLVHDSNWNYWQNGLSLGKSAHPQGQLDFQRQGLSLSDTRYVFGRAIRLGN